MVGPCAAAVLSSALWGHCSALWANGCTAPTGQYSACRATAPCTLWLPCVWYVLVVPDQAALCARQRTSHRAQAAKSGTIMLRQEIIDLPKVGGGCSPLHCTLHSVVVTALCRFQLAMQGGAPLLLMLYRESVCDTNRSHMQFT